MTAIDLRTRYLELDLPHPVVASASPLTRSVEGICQLADAGAAAVVMASIYEEQIVAAELAELALLEADGGTHPEASGGFFPATVTERSVLDQRLETLRRAAEVVPPNPAPKAMARSSPRTPSIYALPRWPVPNR